MKEQLESVTYLWPLATYKISEFFKRIFGESITIKSSHGEITGVKMFSIYGFNYINFLGVPYAKPPIGSLRFKDPEPADPWTQPFHACHETMASQKDVIIPRYMGSEDCLHMNIFTKDLNPKILFPVMVFLHGGAFLFGSNSKDICNPEYLLRKDVVVTVVNYRLGIFGQRVGAMYLGNAMSVLGNKKTSPSIERLMNLVYMLLPSPKLIAKP